MLAGNDSGLYILVMPEGALRGFLRKSQPLAAAATESFLEFLCSTLRTVPTPTPSSRATARQEAPWAHSSATLLASTNFRGRPIRAPRARAAAIPGRTRSRISSRSNFSERALRVLGIMLHTYARVAEWHTRGT